MAEQTAQDQIQALGLTKRMLGLAETEPLACAFALTKDKKECVLLVAKTGNGKKASATLKAEGKAFVDPQTLRFGRVAIDLATDPGLVKFTVNRSEAGGTLIHMTKLVKKAGYQTLIINADEALENEAEGSEDDAAAPPHDAAADLDTLKKRLAGLIQRAMTEIAAAPAKKDTLLTLAKQSQQVLAGGDLHAATQSLDILEAALGAPSTAPQAAAMGHPATGAVVYAKSRLAWIATSRKVASDIEKLRAILETRYGKHDNGAQIVDLYNKRVEPVLLAFDEALADTLDEATNATDAAARQKLVGDARHKIDEYKAFLDGEPLIGDLDDNPFVKLSIRATLGTTLTALSASVR